ncbi:MAG: hypothetical protein BWY21_00493 [Parcubacteria group bacterium ADurb.Bin216]|nr:MAG: hypothetical protein BWY21_00493 [Parcubacteria group bacterium ADurb.Bin216]
MKKLKDLLTEATYGYDDISEVAEKQFKMIASKLKFYKNLKSVKTYDNSPTLFQIKIKDNTNEDEYDIFISKESKRGTNARSNIWIITPAQYGNSHTLKIKGSVYWKPEEVITWAKSL